MLHVERNMAGWGYPPWYDYSGYYNNPAVMYHYDHRNVDSSVPRMNARSSPYPNDGSSTNNNVGNDIDVVIEHTSPAKHLDKDSDSVISAFPDNDKDEATCTPKKHTYCLKIFDPSKRLQFIVEKLRQNSKFQSPKELRNCLRAEYSNLICDNKEDFQVGFTKGQRGGRRVWITDSEDLKQLYSTR